MSKPRIDLTGQRFGRLIVLKYVGRNKQGDSRWLCMCDCGQQKTISNSDLKSGNTQSCGCLRIKHGHSQAGQVSQIYSAWRHMIQRCNNPNDKYYHFYGGRGITVCKRWLKFENFLADMGEPPTKKYSLDRKDNDKGYSKGNCRWATRQQQQDNMRSNHLITCFGKTQCIAKWARETGINQKTLWHRIVTLNWLPEKALTAPIRRKKKR